MLRRHYTTQRLVLVQSEPALARRVVDFYCKNEEFLRPVEPAREKLFYTEDFHRRMLARDAKNAHELTALRLWLLPAGAERDGEVMGTAALSGIAYGAFRSAFLSYKLGAAHTGQGLMREALQRLIQIAFEDISLHRLELDILPGNAPALKMAESLGFYCEGLAQKLRKVNGEWRDHLRTVLLSEQ